MESKKTEFCVFKEYSSTLVNELLFYLQVRIASIIALKFSLC